MEDWCRNFISENKLDSVEMLGFVPNDEVKKIVGQSKALILPTQWYEGFPMSIVEAFSVGTAVVCSDLGNAGSIVDDGITGYRFKADSAENLIQAVNQLSAYSNIHETTFKEYEERFSQTQNYKCLENIYREIL
jgi:glycosyltransferase involved in cell wall biosynthesis